MLLGRKSERGGFHFDAAIDMWSLGCIAAELFIGEPLFQGSCHYDQIRQIEALMGPLPMSLLTSGRLTQEFYHYHTVPGSAQSAYRFLHPIEQQANARYYNHKYEPPQPPPRVRLNLDSLRAVALRNRADLSSTAYQRLAFADVLRGLLACDPNDRWTAEQAALHPFWQRQDLPGGKKKCVSFSHIVKGYEFNRSMCLLTTVFFHFQICAAAGR